MSPSCPTGIADLDAAVDLIAARGCALGQPLHVLAATASTNDDAKRAAKEGAPHGATWVADVQSAGRGRQGRAWIAEPGEGLLFSVLLRLPCVPSRVPLLALGAGLAVRDAVASFTAADASPVDVRIKWPNDVLAGGRKLAGVLVESTTAGSAIAAVIVGVGLNVHATHLPPEIEDRATSLARLLAPARAPSRGALLAEALARLDAILPLVAARGLAPIHARIEAADALRGLDVRSEGGAGRAAGIDREGRLLVELTDGSLARWTAGEVHIGRSVGDGPG